MSFKLALLISLGGAIGTLARYGCSVFIQQYYQQPFPLGTLLINITGCFLIGIFYALAAKNQLLNQESMLLLTTGFCGGFTTFSAFGWENVQLFQTGKILLAIVYITASIILGILATWLGCILVR